MKGRCVIYYHGRWWATICMNLNQNHLTFKPKYAEYGIINVNSTENVLTIEAYTNKDFEVA